MKVNNVKVVSFVLLFTVLLLIWIYWNSSYDIDLKAQNIRSVSLYAQSDIERNYPIVRETKQDIEFILKCIESEDFRLKSSIGKTVFAPNEYIIISFSDYSSKSFYEVFYAIDHVYLVVNKKRQRVYYSNSSISYSQLSEYLEAFLDN